MWLRLTAEQFLKGYSDSDADAICDNYDQLREQLGKIMDDLLFGASDHIFRSRYGTPKNVGALMIFSISTRSL